VEIMNRRSLNAAASVLAIMALSLTLQTRAWAAPKESARYESTVLRVDVTGKGQPMLLIPGLTCPGDVWRETVAHYSSRFECHVVSLGGFGGRPRFEGPFLGTARDSLLAYIRSHNLKR